MRAMIFAAGLGTRLRPLTDRMPKALAPILGKPLLLWQIEMLKKVGMNSIIINVHHKAEQIIRYLQEHRNFDCDIRISDEQDELLETGGGLKKALTLYPSAEPYDNEPALVVVSHRHTQRYLAFDRDLQLRGWTNTATGQVRPEGQDLTDTQLLAFSGMQIVSPCILDDMQQIRTNKFSLIDLYMNIIEKKGSIKAFIPDDYQMMDVGKIEQLTEVEQWANEWLM